MRKAYIASVIIAGAGAWIWYLILRGPELPPPFYIEYSLRVEYQGELVEFSHPIECVAEVFPQGLGDADRVAYQVAQKSFGHRLEDGSAILVVTPQACQSFNRKRKDPSVNPFPEDFIPVVAWVKNPDEPKNIEAYVSRSYYESASPRIRYLGMEGAVLASDQIEHAQTKFDWFYRQSDIAPRDPDKAAALKRYVAYYSRCIGRKQWETDPRFREAVNEVGQTGPINLSFLSKSNSYGQNLARPTVSQINLFGGSQVPYKEISSSQRTFDDVIPFRSTEKGLVQDFDSRGAIILNAPFVSTERSDFTSPILKLGSVVFHSPNHGPNLFVRESGLICKVWNLFFLGPKKSEQ